MKLVSCSILTIVHLDIDVKSTEGELSATDISKIMQLQNSWSPTQTSSRKHVNNISSLQFYMYNAPVTGTVITAYYNYQSYPCVYVIFMYGTGIHDLLFYKNKFYRHMIYNRTP